MKFVSIFPGFFCGHIEQRAIWSGNYLHSSLKHISATLARRPNKGITLSRTNLSNTGNSPRDSDIPIIKLTPGSHVGSPWVYMRRQRAKGGRGAGFGVVGGGDLTQPPSNFSKILVYLRHSSRAPIT